MGIDIFSTSACRMALPGIAFLVLVALSPTDLRAGPSPQAEEQAMAVIARMEAAYGRVEGYRTETEVREYRDGRVVETKRFRYTFKKPNHLRIDMESPDRGMILVYPDREGKVFVKPAGLIGFLKLHLSPDSTLLRNSSGQRIDQTDFGLLIRNMARSLTDRRQGEIDVSEQDDRVVIKVLAEDHFIAGVLTLYSFSIDRTRWFPMELEESTPDGVQKRKVIFRNMMPAADIPDSVFRINGGSPGHE